jgi:large subunit ribosomal protein L30
MSAELRVTQVRSGIGTKPKHRATLRALGLRGLGQSNTLPDRPEIRGMLARVPHLVTVENMTAPAGAGAPSLGEESGVGAPLGENEGVSSDAGS